ncbi:uncharacterized protein [Magallana gigas]|uniref:uncharacterized protein n=1 Tax=Magallana gigas TaxID=29159 RepID=UPI003342C715
MGSDITYTGSLPPMDWCLIREVEVSLAKKKPTWQSSEKYSSDKAVDGNFSLVGDSCTSEASPTDVTWMVDLEDIKTNSVFASRLLGFSVYVSNTTNKEDGHLCFHDSGNSISTISNFKSITCEVQGRFVIYYNTREGNDNKRPGYSTTAHLDLCEVVVIGCPLGFFGVKCSIPCPPSCRHCNYNTGKCLGACAPGYHGEACAKYSRINLALNRPTYQLNTLNPAYPSSNVVDGKRNDLRLYQCTSTGSGHELALWRVDLEQIQWIERIIVYARTDNKEWDGNYLSKGFLGFSIIVSNTTDHKKGVLCFHDKKYNITTIPPVVDILCSVVGRYVTYYNERLPLQTYPKNYSRYAYVDLCEIEVYGCPLSELGYDDPGCRVPCHEMCKTSE